MSLQEPPREPRAMDLAKCIERSTILTDQIVTWGEIQLRMRYFVGSIEPPLDLVTSVRAVLFADSTVMVMRSRDSTFHINPGGRLEPGESVEDTLRRELLEETGWTIRAQRFLGFIHFAHLSPRPPDYPYPYPEFVQLLFVADAGERAATAQLPVEYEVAAEFLPIDHAHQLLDAAQSTVLAAAIRFRAE